MLHSGDFRVPSFRPDYNINTMVVYTLPKYISKSQRDVALFTFSAADARKDAPAPSVSTCLRCFVNIAKSGRVCYKPQNNRCGHCAAGHHECVPVCTISIMFSERVQR